FSAVALGSCFGKKYFQTKTILIGMVCSVIPDADAITFKFGIPYSSVWGHRGFTHSILFAIILSSLVIILFFRKENSRKVKIVLLTYFFLSTLLHPLLDSCTNGGLGV